jgi:hypothetical protein
MVPLIAYLLFSIYKFFGYSLAGKMLNIFYSKSSLSAWKVGLVRTLIGMIAGGSFTLAWYLLESHGFFRHLGMTMGRGGSSLYYLAALIPIRIFEWGLVVWIFYDRRFEKAAKALVFIVAGVMWSFLLDLPVILGLLRFVASIC